MPVRKAILPFQRFFVRTAHLVVTKDWHGVITEVADANAAFSNSNRQKEDGELEKKCAGTVCRLCAGFQNCLPVQLLNRWAIWSYNLGET